MADEVSGAGTPTILIVDDSPDNISLIHSLLKSSYRTKIATDGETALRLMSNGNPPDLVLLDVVMPGLDGYEVCRRLKENPKTAEIPIIFLTARSDVDDEKTGLEFGAVDYITKPISPAIVPARVRTHLQLKSARDFLRDKSEFLEQEVQRRTREINAIQDATMVAMGSLGGNERQRDGKPHTADAALHESARHCLKDHPRYVSSHP